MRGRQHMIPPFHLTGTRDFLGRHPCFAEAEVQRFPGKSDSTWGLQRPRIIQNIQGHQSHRLRERKYILFGIVLWQLVFIFI